MAGGAKGSKAAAQTPSTSRKRTKKEAEKEEEKEVPVTRKKAVPKKKDVTNTAKENTKVSKKVAKAPVNKAKKEAEVVEEGKTTAVKSAKGSGKGAPVPQKSSKNTVTKKEEAALGKGPKGTKKRGKPVEEEEDGPSTSKRARKEEEEDQPSTSKKSIKKESIKEEGKKEKKEKDEVPKRRELSEKEKELIRLIEAEEEKKKVLRAELAAQEAATAKSLKEQEAVKKEWMKVKDVHASLKATAAAAEKVVYFRAKCIESKKKTMAMHAERIKLLERNIVRLQTIMESKDVQSARRGREALTLRTENRRLKRYLSTLRAGLERLAEGRRTPFIERLLEMAEEDFDPVEEQRRLREEMRAGRNPNSIYF